MRLSPVLVVALLAAAPGVADADALDDDPTPPTVSIAKPASRSELPAGTTKATIEVRADDEESGISEVRLIVDGAAVRTLDGDPWVFADVELASGTHEITAVAANGFAEEATSSPVTIVVAVAAPPPEAKAEPADAKAEPAPVPPAKAVADTKPPADAKAEPAPAPADPAGQPATKDGCFASARPRSLIGSGIAFAIAMIAGLALRRRG